MAVILTSSHPAGRHHLPKSVSRNRAPETPGIETAAQLVAVRRLAGYGLPIYCAGPGRRLVALTFDDGPGQYTQLALQALSERHLVATFFLVGREVRARPDSAQREKPYGAFGDHTMTHPFLPALSRGRMVEEIAEGKALVERTVGEPVVMFRPPFAGRSAAVDVTVRRLGMLDVLWTVDSQDWRGIGYQQIERNVIGGLRPGSIVLMHENHAATIRALPAIFAALARSHLQAVTVPQLIDEDPPSISQLRAGPAGCGAGHASAAGG